jgi:hypothetical protein
MMKVKVSYTTTVEEVIEVDEKFYALTAPGGWNELSNKERDSLTEEFLEEVVNHTDADCHHDILWIEEDGSEELMYEG